VVRITKRQEIEAVAHETYRLIAARHSHSLEHLRRALPTILVPAIAQIDPDVAQLSAICAWLDQEA